MTRHAYRAAVLAAMPGTRREIEERAHVSESTARAWINYLRRSGESHIGHWVATPGRPLPFHLPGPGKDAKKPKCKTGSQYCRESRERAKLNGTADIRKIKRQAKIEAKRAASKPNKWFSALLAPVRKSSYSAK